MKVHGSCSCGFITFEAEADPEGAGLDAFGATLGYNHRRAGYGET